MADYQEQQNISEQDSGLYIQLIGPDDKPDIDHLEDADFIHFPEKFLGSVGKVEVLLTKYVESYSLGITANNPGFLISESGFNVISRKDAVKQGLCELDISIDNTLARVRNIGASVYLSFDGMNDTAVGQLRNETQESEEIRATILSGGQNDPDLPEKGTNLFTINWRFLGTKDIKGPIFLKYGLDNIQDHKFLERLRFRVVPIEIHPRGVPDWTPRESLTSI